MKRVDISGFSGPYENACQTMLQCFLDATEALSFEDLFPEVDGKRKLNSETEKKFHSLIDDVAPSGAMWGATISHFAFIKKKGYDAWIKAGEDKNGIIEWKPKGRKHFDSPEEAFEAGKKIGEELRQSPEVIE